MATEIRSEPWNKGKIVGQKAPFKLKDVWAIRVRLQLAHRERELALFNLGIDSKLRACDLVQLRVKDICHGDRVATRAIVMQQKTHRPVQFEITEQTREAVAAWIRSSALHSDAFLFWPHEIWPSNDAPVLADCPILDSGARSRLPAYATHSDQENEGVADLSAHEKPASRPTAIGPLQAGEYRALSRHRGR